MVADVGLVTSTGSARAPPPRSSPTTPWNGVSTSQVTTMGDPVQHHDDILMLVGDDGEVPVLSGIARQSELVDLLLLEHGAWEDGGRSPVPLSFRLLWMWLGDEAASAGGRIPIPSVQARELSRAVYFLTEHAKQPVTWLCRPLRPGPLVNSGVPAWAAAFIASIPSDELLDLSDAADVLRVPAYACVCALSWVLHPVIPIVTPSPIPCAGYLPLYTPGLRPSSKIYQMTSWMLRTV